MTTVKSLSKNYDKQSLSVCFSKSVLFAVSSIFAVITVFTTISQIRRLSFHTYSSVGMVLIATTFLISLGFSVRYFNKENINKDYRILVGLIMLASFTVVIALISLQQDEDDLYYVPNIVHYLEHPSEEMDYSVHFFVENDPPIPSYGFGVSIAYEYFQGLLAYVTQIEFLIFYYQIMPCIVGFLLTLVIFFLLSCFTDDTYACLLGTMVILSLLLLLLETDRSYGSLAFIRFKHGKSIMLSLGIPTTVAFSLYYFRKRSAYYWITLLVVFTSMTGLSQSSIVLFPVLSVGLMIAHILSKPLTKQDIKLALQYFASQILLVTYALFLLTRVTLNIGTNSPINLGRYPLTFEGQAKLLFLEPYTQSPAIIIGLLSFAGIILLVRGWQRRFLVAWIIATITLFLNPLSAPILMTYVTSQNIYWRMFYILPFPLITGVVTIQLSNLLSVKHRQWIGILTTSCILAIAVVSFHANGHIKWQRYKYPQYRVQYAQDIIKVAPPGPILAPLAIGNAIPIFNSGYPQYSIKGENTALFLGSTEQAEIRDAATHFVTYGGDKNVLDRFLQIEQPSAIVISIAAVGKESTRNILERHHYTEFKRLDDIYFVYWQLSKQNK